MSTSVQFGSQRSLAFAGRVQNDIRLQTPVRGQHRRPRKGVFALSGITRHTLSVAEAANLVGVHRLTLYEAVRRGEIKVVRVGRRVLIPVDELERLLRGEPWTPPTREEVAR